MPSIQCNKSCKNTGLEKNHVWRKVALIIIRFEVNDAKLFTTVNIERFRVAVVVRKANASQHVQKGCVHDCLIAINTYRMDFDNWLRRNSGVIKRRTLDYHHVNYDWIRPCSHERDLIDAPGLILQALLLVGEGHSFTKEEGSHCHAPECESAYSQQLTAGKQKVLMQSSRKRLAESRA